MSFVLFYSPSCPYSMQFMPVFRELPRHVHGCVFAMLNVSTNFDLIQRSQHTSLVIDEVPFLILFYNGVPMLKYDSDLTLPAIRDFILECTTEAKTADSARAFAAKNKRRRGGSAMGTEENTTGIPIYGTGNIVSYLTFEELDSVRGASTASKDVTRQNMNGHHFF